MQCARCKHGWREDVPAETENKAESTDAILPISAPIQSEVIKERAILSQRYDRLKLFILSLPPQKKLLLKRSTAGVIALLFLSLLITKRALITDKWPVMDKVYDLVGLHVYHYGGVGLSFEQMRSELHYDSGLTELYVEGKIHNKTVKVQEIPDILATAIGANGQVIQSWQIDAPATSVSPGEMVTFHSSIKAPEGTVVDINLNFVETKNDE